VDGHIDERLRRLLPISSFGRTSVESGGSGSVGATLAGALLLGLVFNVLNFENGLGWISLSAYWQSVILGAFLLVVVILQARLTAKSAT
jgi:ribose transport system permease protein